MNEFQVDQLESVWQTLISYGLPPANEIKVYEISGKFAAGSVLLAVDSAGLRHLLVPLPIGETAKEDKKGAGIRITHHAMIDRGIRANFVDIACRNSQLHSAFLYLACEVLQELSSISTGVGEACIKAINNWRALLERERASIIPREKIIGLAGELIQLINFLKMDLSADLIWGGPEGHRHDFSNGVISLEVKTTTMRHGLSVTINSIDQLEPLPGGQLYLSLVSLEEVSEGGITIESLVREIEGMTPFSSRILAKIRQYGWESISQSDESSLHFILRKITIFRVDNPFPRLIPSRIIGGLPPQITNVQYVIDLTGSEPAPLSAEDIKNVYRSILSK